MHRRHAIVALACLLAAGSVHAGTCTIQPQGLRSLNYVGSAGNLLFPVGSADGHALAVDVDEAAGTFVVRRESIPAFEFDSPAGLVVLTMSGPVVSGRIDRAGHVRLAPWNIDATMVEAQLVLPQSPSFSTGLKSNRQFEDEYPSVGVPLDFATGLLTLDGNSRIASAPLVEEPVATNFKLTCRLDPIPSDAVLPAGATLAKPRGVAKVTGAAEGDSLVLAARLVPPAEGLEIADRDVVIQIGAAPETALLVAVAHADVLAAKGKKRLVKDADGAALRVVAGRKVAGSAPVATSGSLTLTPGKKGIAVKLALKGLDLAALAGTQPLVIGIGDVTASATMTVSGSGKKRKLK